MGLLEKMKNRRVYAGVYAGSPYTLSILCMQMYGVYAETPFFIGREKNAPLIFFFQKKKKWFPLFVSITKSISAYTAYTAYTFSI
jgi:hypothetical protein